MYSEDREINFNFIPKIVVKLCYSNVIILFKQFCITIRACFFSSISVLISTIRSQCASLTLQFRVSVKREISVFSKVLYKIIRIYDITIYFFQM